MCMIATAPLQQGEPLTDEMLAAMDAAEAGFWRGFLEEAKTVLAAKKRCGFQTPYIPTSSLYAKYRRAIKEFAGGKYCPVKQLEELFAFGNAK